MLSPLRYRTLLAIVVPLLAVGVSACKPLCVGQFDLWIERGYTFEGQTGSVASYKEPANVWTDNPVMAAFLVDELRWHDRQAILSKYRFDCLPSAEADCVVCTRTVRDVRDYECKPVGEMLVRAYFGPGNTVRAQTYWRR